MIARVIHAVIAAQNEKGGLQMFLGFDRLIDLLDYAVHFRLLRDHMGTVIRVNVGWAGLFPMLIYYLLGPDLCPMWSSPR